FRCVTRPRASRSQPGRGRSDPPTRARGGWYPFPHPFPRGVRPAALAERVRCAVACFRRPAGRRSGPGHSRRGPRTWASRLACSPAPETRRASPRPSIRSSPFRRSQTNWPRAGACVRWPLMRPLSATATRISCTRPPRSCVIRSIASGHRIRPGRDRSVDGNDTSLSWDSVMKSLVGLANGLLTMWEQVRGRRRHRAATGPAEASGSRWAQDGPAATVILLNWQRLSNVRTILDVYTRYRWIAEIIVWNNNPELTFTHRHPKVRSVNSGELGLSTRWAAALLASHGCRIGLDRRYVPHYFLALEELGLCIDPARGGGEDIVMSFALTHATGKRPLVVPGSYRDLLAPNGLANRYGSQRQNRTLIMRRCQAWFDGSARTRRDQGTHP